MGLYEDESHQGRRAVLPLDQSIKIIKEKFTQKEKFMQLIDKYGKQTGVSRNEIRVPGARISSLRDLV